MDAGAVTRPPGPRRALLRGVVGSCVAHAALIGWLAGGAVPVHPPALLSAQPAVVHVGVLSAAEGHTSVDPAASTGSRREPVRRALAAVQARPAAPPAAAKVLAGAAPATAPADPSSVSARAGPAAAEPSPSLGSVLGAGSTSSLATSVGARTAPAGGTDGATGSGRPTGPQALPGNPLPAYPQAAREDGLEGRVVLDLAIDRDGRVADVRILQRSGANVLDFAAAEAARSWRFRPAFDGHQVVASHTELAIRFVLQGASVQGNLALAALDAFHR